LGDKLGGQVSEAEKRIADQRAQVLAGLEQMAGEIAQSVYAKLAGQPADQGTLNSKVAAAIKGGSR
jgi:F-type H+-transporting ATPase subunit b